LFGLDNSHYKKINILGLFLYSPVNFEENKMAHKTGYEELKTPSAQSEGLQVAQMIDLGKKGVARPAGTATGNPTPLHGQPPAQNPPVVQPPPAQAPAKPRPIWAMPPGG
jgi:hypothetical protein